MARPRDPKPPRGPDIDDPAHPDYMHPAALRRLEQEFFDRVDHLIDVVRRKAEAAGMEQPPEPSPEPSPKPPFISNS